MAQSRRDFLRNSACALGSMALASTVDSLGLINAYAQSAAASDYRALVCIFLSGGNDCNNLVVDLNQFNSYNNVRNGAGLAIPKGTCCRFRPRAAARTACIRCCRN
jgi:uncharacterized protein (DUF1501 family)